MGACNFCNYKRGFRNIEGNLQWNISGKDRQENRQQPTSALPKLQQHQAEREVRF